ncbi:MAG: nucleotidyltransferase family protein [Armatimonadota bacterium]|nr:nucleotidyltransferase family protein [bacterium]MDW8322146.1 nucleotidyltransferase family protein [Armatimonadota bacterium]
MRTLEEIRAIIRQHQPELRERYGVAAAGIFGSYVRGEQRPDSDLDVLVDIVRPISLFELVGAEIYLEELLGIKVDLVPYRAVREELREPILAEAIPV